MKSARDSINPLFVIFFIGLFTFLLVLGADFYLANIDRPTPEQLALGKVLRNILEPGGLTLIGLPGVVWVLIPKGNKDQLKDNDG